MILLNVESKNIHQKVNIREKNKQTRFTNIENKVVVTSAEMGEGGII